jgi:hypothetical protein
MVRDKLFVLDVLVVLLLRRAGFATGESTKTFAHTSRGSGVSVGDGRLRRGTRAWRVSRRRAGCRRSLRGERNGVHLGKRRGRGDGGRVGGVERSSGRDELGRRNTGLRQILPLFLQPLELRHRGSLLERLSSFHHLSLLLLDLPMAHHGLT